MLWFDGQAEEAANFYVSLFPNSKIENVTKGPDGNAFTVTFMILGSEYIALNGGPHYKVSEACSIFITCDGQEEVDKYWDQLIANGGSESQCGWLKDKFGLSWQIVPKQLGECLGNPDPEKAGRAMAAMMQMKKIIVKDLEDAVR